MRRMSTPCLMLILQQFETEAGMKSPVILWVCKRVPPVYYCMSMVFFFLLMHFKLHCTSRIIQSTKKVLPWVEGTGILKVYEFKLNEKVNTLR